MQITESIVAQISRKTFNQMFDPALRRSKVLMSGNGSSVNWADNAGHANSADSLTDLSQIESMLADYVSDNELETTLANYATKTYVDQNYLSLSFFNALFQARTSQGATVAPNSGDTTTIDNIKAMFGFWTDQYISALGQGADGGAITSLAALTDVQLSLPLADGEVLTYNSTLGKWTNGAGVSTAWANITGKPTTIAGYGITDAHITNGVITLGANTITPITSLTGYATETWVNTLLADYVTTSGLATTLADYVTATALSTTLADYVTSTALSTTLADYATKTYVDQNYLSLSFFNALFQARTSQGALVSPNSGDVSTIDNIKAMFGFWTDQYISALGQGSDGGGYTLNEPLSSINSAALGTPSQANVAIVWNGTAWTYGTTMSSLSWSYVTNNTTTLAGYGITDAASSSDLANYLPLSGGTLAANNTYLTPARMQLMRPDGTKYSDRACIGVTNGNLHLDAYNGYAIYLNYYQDNTSGSEYKKIYFNGETYYINKDGYYNGSVSWSNVSGRPTNVSSFTNDSGYITSSALSSYLPLSAGSSYPITGPLYITRNNNDTSPNLITKSGTSNVSYLEIKTSDNNAIVDVGAIKGSTWGIPSSGGAYLWISGNGSNGGIFVNASGLYYTDSSSDFDKYTVYHTGNLSPLTTSNYSSYCLPLSGGTLSGSSSTVLKISTTSYSNYIDFLTNSTSKAQLGYYYGSGLFIQNETSTWNYPTFIISDDGLFTFNAKNTWLSNAMLQLMRNDTTSYSDRACIGVTDGNLHIDSYPNKEIYLNYYSGKAILHIGNYTVYHTGNLSPLTTSNYSSYCLPLSGGTVNGNLKISGTKNLSNGSSVWDYGLIAGADGHDKVVASYLYSDTRGAVIGAHNSNLTAWAVLNVSGTQINFRIQETIKCYIDSSGNFVSNTGVTALSDIRHKDILNDTTIKVEDIARMRSVAYRWNDGRDDNEIHVGSIAQDWQSVLPEVVMRANDTEGTLSLQYGVAALISSITIARKVVDHEKRITELERECADWREDYNALRMDYEQLKLKIA